MANTTWYALPGMVAMPHFRLTAGQWMNTTQQVHNFFFVFLFQWICTYTLTFNNKWLVYKSLLLHLNNKLTNLVVHILSVGKQSNGPLRWKNKHAYCVVWCTWILPFQKSLSESWFCRELQTDSTTNLVLLLVIYSSCLREKRFEQILKRKGDSNYIRDTVCINLELKCKECGRLSCKCLNRPYSCFIISRHMNFTLSFRSADTKIDTESSQNCQLLVNFR